MTTKTPKALSDQASLGMDAFQCACEALAAELRATQPGLDVGLDARLDARLAESLSADLSAGLHSLLRVPGVASVVERAVRRAEYDLLKARLVTLVSSAKQHVLHPLLSKELDRLTLVELQNSADNFEVSIAGGIDSIDETRGAELRLHEYDLQKLDPPVVARLEWSEDLDGSFEVVSSDFSALGPVHSQCWRKMFHDGRASSGPIMRRICVRLEQLIRNHNSLSHTLRHFGVLVVWSKTCERTLVSPDEVQGRRSAACPKFNSLVDRVGRDLSGFVSVPSLVLCYLQFDFIESRST